VRRRKQLIEAKIFLAYQRQREKDLAALKQLQDERKRERKGPPR
jgi:hypothetical protein